MKKIILPFGLSLLLLSCSSKDEKSDAGEEKDTSSNEEVIQETCTYSYNPESTEVSWIAFKLADKQAVNGSFLTFDIQGATEAASVTDLLNSLNGSVSLQSVSTNDTLRDWKIEHFFFGMMSDTLQAKARIENASYTSADFILSLNGVEKSIPAKVNYSSGELSLECEINIMDFNAQKSHEAINKACEEKHKGNGDEAVTWPEVKILISTTLDIDCQEAE